MNHPISFYCKHLTDMSASHLYQLMALRSQIFVVEQACIYQDLDGIDLGASSFQVYLIQDHKIIGGARIIYHEKEVKIGRVTIEKNSRGRGIGHQLMSYCIKQCEQKWPSLNIIISAQSHLQDFYIQHGFQATSNIYLEDNIPHIRMEKDTK